MTAPKATGRNVCNKLLRCIRGNIPCAICIGYLKSSGIFVPRFRPRKTMLNSCRRVKIEDKGFYFINVLILKPHRVPYTLILQSQ